MIKPFTREELRVGMQVTVDDSGKPDAQVYHIKQIEGTQVLLTYQLKTGMWVRPMEWPCVSCYRPTTAQIEYNAFKVQVLKGKGPSYMYQWCARTVEEANAKFEEWHRAYPSKTVVKQY